MYKIHSIIYTYCSILFCWAGWRTYNHSDVSCPEVSNLYPLCSFSDCTAYGLYRQAGVPVCTAGACKVLLKWGSCILMYSITVLTLILPEYWRSIERGGIYVVCEFVDSFPKPRRRLPCVASVATPLLSNRLCNTLPKSTIACRLGATILFNGCHTKDVKVWQVPIARKSLARTISLWNHPQMAHPQFTRVLSRKTLLSLQYLHELPFRV